MPVFGVSLGVFLMAVAMGGIVFNIYILFFSCTKTNNQNRTASQLLLFHLGFLNILLALIFVVAIAPVFFSDTWLEDPTCNFVGPIWDCLHIVAVWTVTLLNADKYITIASPLHYARFVSPSKAAIALVLSWMLAVLLVASTPLLPGLSYRIRATACILDIFSSPNMAGKIYTGVTNGLGFVLPILIVALTNGRILIIASHHRHRIVAALWDVTISAQATVTQQKSHFYLTNYKGRSAATTIFYHVGSLLIMYLPITVCRIYEAVTRVKVSPTVSTAAFILLAISPTINGFVYGVRSKVLRKLLMHVLRKQIYKSEVSCEIQARTPTVSCSRRPSITPSIALPLQKQLTRRMSEIFTPTSTTTSASSQNSGEGKGKIERQSSDVSSGKGRSSGTSTPKDITPPPSFRPPRLSPLTKFFPKGLHFQRSLELNTPPGDTPGTPFFTGTPNSFTSFFSFNKDSALEMMTNGSGHNGGHRQSLRRALFARNKQKSLDLDTAHVQAETGNFSKCPPRSASHNQVQEQLHSPSAVRPLLLSSDPLTPGRKSKKVSWSSDSFTNSDKSVQNSPSQSETDINRKWKRRAFFKQNGFKKCSKPSLYRQNSVVKEDHYDKTNELIETNNIPIKNHNTSDINNKNSCSTESNEIITTELNFINSFSKENRDTASELTRINSFSKEHQNGTVIKHVANGQYQNGIKGIEHICHRINVFDNPLSESIPNSKVSEASIIANIRVCH